VGVDRTAFLCGSLVFRSCEIEVNRTASVCDDCHVRPHDWISRSVPQFCDTLDRVTRLARPCDSIDSSRVATVGHWNLPFGPCR